MNTFNITNQFEEINLTADNIYNSVINSIMDDCNISLWDEETNVLMENTEKLIDDNIYMCDEYADKLKTRITDIAVYASDSAFEKGFKMGLSLLKNLITAEPPTIETAPAFERREKPKSNVSGFIPFAEKDKQLLKLLNNAVLCLNENQKIRLNEMVLSMMYKN